MLGGGLLLVPQLLPQVTISFSVHVADVLGASGRMGAGRQFRQLCGRQLDRVPGAPGLGGHFPGAVDQKVRPVRLRLGQSGHEGTFLLF